MAGAVMPLIAQTFVESRSNTTFDIIATSSNNDTNGAPLQRFQRRQVVNSPSLTSSEKVKRIGQRQSPRNNKDSPKGKAKDDEVYYWSDAKLTETFKFVREVGYGNWGSLWLSKLYADRQINVALKLVHRSRDPTSSARVRALWNEYKCMRVLRSTPHANLINFHAFILTPSYSLVAMDYHPQLVQVAIPESRAKIYAQQLFSAVEHLHVHGITHNDIKPSNILLSSDDRPILIDFGFAQQWDMRSPDRFLSSLSWGTPEYLSPERAKGQLHDERLSDIWALGITVYEIVVGRTPFEESEEEDFLTKGQLELYYHRSLTGKIYGDYLISSELENLVGLMVDPNPHTRAQSCGKALQHRFFNPISPAGSKSKTASMPSTPQSTASSVTRSPAPTSSAKKTPKKKEKSFIIFEDETVPSPARTGDSVSPFSPRSGALANRTNQSPFPADSTPTRNRVISAPMKKTPPPSRIPVRKHEVASPPIKCPLAIRSARKPFVADTNVPVPPLPSNTMEESVDRVKLQQQANVSKQKTPSPPARTSSLHNRSASTSSVKRKPVPALLDDFFELSNVSLSLITQSPKLEVIDKADSNGNREEILSSNRTSPIIFEDPRLSKDRSPSLSKTSAFLKRSFSKKPSKSSNIDTSLIGEFAFPTLSSPSSEHKATPAVTERLRKMSAPLRNVPRPSISIMAGMKRSIFTIARRRTSSSASSFSFIDAEKLQEPREFVSQPPTLVAELTPLLTDSLTMPTRVPAPANVDVEAQKARLSAFSSHIQHILETRRSLERDAQEVAAEPESSVKKATRGSSKAAPFSYNGTAPLESVDESSQLATPPIVKKGRPSSKSSPALSHESSPSPSDSSYRPGHRRIPTAIRNVPSVVLHESADEEGLASELETAKDESASERVASPPPPPRVVEPSRQLPTWVPNDEDSDEDDDNLADVDEPTITIGMTPRLRKPSKVSTIGKKSSSKAISVSRQLSHSSPIRTPTVSIDDQRVTRPANPRSNTSTSRTSTPTPEDLPFHNLHHRSDSRASTTQSSNHGHSRSRSVISFFTRSVSRASETSSLGWSTSSEVPVNGNAMKVKKPGKLRRAVSKIFR